jgi:hypothetical protein
MNIFVISASALTRHLDHGFRYGRISPCRIASVVQPIYEYIANCNQILRVYVCLCDKCVSTFAHARTRTHTHTHTDFQPS